MKTNLLRERIKALLSVLKDSGGTLPPCEQAHTYLSVHNINRRTLTRVNLLYSTISRTLELQLLALRARVYNTKEAAKVLKVLV